MAPILTAVLLLIQPLSEADVYKWIDREGVAHYTDRPRHAGYRLLVRDRRAGGTFGLEQMRANRTKYTPLIDSLARRHAVEPALVHAVIRAESAYDPSAVSHAGAVGLMQLMPQTARHYGVWDRRDPHQNVEGGVRHLRDLLERFRQLDLALAAYNAGETAVVRHGNRIPPYRETRQYVRRVLTFYRQHQRGT